MYDKNSIIEKINKIRKDIDHDKVDINIKEIFLKNKDLWIIGEDRVDKSAIIGKGGWVVGRLKEDLSLDNIHVESYEEFILKKYKLELSLKYLNKFINETKLNKEPFLNLKTLIENKINNIYSFNYKEFFKNNDFNTSQKAIVALSGGVDSSFSLIIAKALGFDVIAISIDPGSIILPNHFKRNIENLTEKLNVPHKYVKSDYTTIIEESLSGKKHPCGNCSKQIEEEINKVARSMDIPLVIYGDMISTGNQSIKVDGNITRLNLPAILLTSKYEIKELVSDYGIEKIEGFGCPLLYEVHKKYPHMKKFSIGRILRETRASALESGEALDLIWSFYK
ncbi:7-cyano-7-deazaguanine synthase [Methanobrevibacter sp. DSM 116169]|uniref:7-cyano-7-deazaguanine synthase n=1 Tax=Methanobrevibacter sp. DSM 116169 TaxID=3242727 RepID=UPI0038FC4D27